MATTKTATATLTVTFHIDPVVKEALRTAAAREHRSIANMVEVLIRDIVGATASQSRSRATCLATKTKTEPGRPA